jgi:hypothetical protein
MSEVLGDKKLCRWAQIRNQTHLTLSFGPNPSLAPCSTPLYFLTPNFKFHPLFQLNWGFLYLLSMTLQITLIFHGQLLCHIKMEHEIESMKVQQFHHLNSWMIFYGC